MLAVSGLGECKRTFGGDCSPNVADQEASHPRKRATQEYSYHFLFYSKLHQNQKALAYYTMPNQSLPSCEAETTIQNVIQDLSSGVKPLIRKASGAYNY